uniref:Uncharacterized protein n=1 Tax=Amphimedon queenslandica TaxID=400682 RepID=A0A1X7UGY6_AMPQE
MCYIYNCIICMYAISISMKLNLFHFNLEFSIKT